MASSAALVMDGGASFSSRAAARPEASEVVAEVDPPGETTNCYKISQLPEDRICESGRGPILASKPVWQTHLSVQSHPGYPEICCFP